MTDSARMVFPCSPSIEKQAERKLNATFVLQGFSVMILSTSHRLGRVVDRVRSLSDRLEELPKIETEIARDRQEVIFAQLDKLTSRARILQRSMVTFYLALGMFVATSVAIGVVAINGSARYNLIPVICGLVGASFLFYGSML
jgi:tRNA/tmRNA/rRNA uracil-C5-methylase (TrmA/RlmC/RlmD family)